MTDIAPFDRHTPTVFDCTTVKYGQSILHQTFRDAPAPFWLRWWDSWLRQRRRCVTFTTQGYPQVGDFLRYLTPGGEAQGVILDLRRLTWPTNGYAVTLLVKEGRP